MPLTLKHAARQSRRMMFGWSPSLAGSQHLLEREVDGVALNGLAWFECRPDVSTFDFTIYDADYALAEGRFATRGFPFVTSIGNPAWLLDALIATPSSWQGLLEDHIDGVFAHLGANPGFRYWEIVNEAIDDGIAADYAGEWFAAAGDNSFIAHAFNYAQTYWPDIPFLLNDYAFEFNGPRGAGRRANMLSYLTTALGAGVPIDYLGTQMHMRWGSQDGGFHSCGLDEVAYAAWLQSIAALGIKLVITEIDCGPDADRSDLTAREIDAANAMLVRRVLDITFDNIDVPYVQTWGLLDEDATYLTNPALRRYGSFDNQGVIKPQGTALIGAMLSRPRAAAELT